MRESVAVRALQAVFAGPKHIFTALGWGLLVLALILALRAEEVRREWIRVEGEIVDFTSGESEAPIVEYTAPNGDRRTIAGGVSTSPRAGKVGDRVPVFLNPQNEDEARLGTAIELWFAPGLLGFIGGGFVLVGTLAGSGSGRLPGLIGERRLRELRETGDRVMARITAIEAIGAAPAALWRLRAEWRGPDGAVHRLISQPIAVDPAPYVKVGDEIGVFIDRQNPGIYAFDFSMLPFDP